MPQQAHIIAQRLLNLYRQEHVIDGGWAAVNPIFISEANSDQIITELENMPTGKKLVMHINNLRSGKTPMDSIDKDLLPYGGLMSDQEITISLTDEEFTELKDMLNTFQPTLENLNKIRQSPLIKKFGTDWIKNIKSALASHPDLLQKWQIVVRTDKAYRAWDSAQQLLSETMTERNRAHIQAEMSEYEMYLPMFGNAGQQMLAKLRTFLSSLT